MLLVPQKIIASTYCSTIFRTHVFSLYSHSSIYIATHLHTEYLDWLWVVLQSNSRGSENHTAVNSEIHSEPVIEQVWRCTSRKSSSINGDTLGVCHWVNLEMHSEIVIKRVSPCTSWPWLREPGPTLWDCKRASVVMHIDVMIMRTRRQ